MSPSPHTPLYAAKTRILARVKEYLQGQARFEISTISFELDSIDLWQLMPYIDFIQKVFFKDREANTEYLGIKFLRTFNSAFAIENAKHLIAENDQIAIIGGQRFHPNNTPETEWSELGSHYYVIPQFLFVRENDKTVLRINISAEAFTRKSVGMSLLLDIEHLFAFKGHHKNKLQFESLTQTPNIEQWSAKIDAAKTAFKSGELDKVVLSRKHVLTSAYPIKPEDVTEKLNIRTGEHFVFHLQWRSDRAFTSVTPERLFKLNGQELSSDAIAGTRPRGKTKDEDLALANELKSSEKELNEHRFVTRAVIETMQKLGANDPTIISNEEIMPLSHVQHLHTKISAYLTKPTRTCEIIDTFHPTPAVGGTPKVDASDWISANEGYDRGFYAAPMGVIHAKGADFCVAIRSALTFGRELHIYAGAGIVEKSDAMAEWLETQNKMKNFPFMPVTSVVPVTENEHEQRPLN